MIYLIVFEIGHDRAKDSMFLVVAVVGGRWSDLMKVA